MPSYDWVCDECRIVFEKDYKVDKLPKTGPRCPQCNCISYRDFGVAGIHFKGAGFHCNDYAHEKPTNKTDGKRFYEDAIKRSGERAKEGWQQYSKYTPNIPNLQKMGVCKGRKSEERIKETLKASKKMTEHTYKVAELDIHKELKRKPQ